MSRPPRRPLFNGALVVAFALGTFWGCSAEVASRLTAEQANRILVALDENGIAASKTREAGAGPLPLYRVEVPRNSLGPALSLLRAGGLPGRPDPGWEQLLENPGLVPTPGEERARLAAALSGELARSIESVDGVVDARVHLYLPAGRKGVLDGPEDGARASVLVRYRTDAPPLGETAIRKLVAGALPAVAGDDVAVVMLRGRPARARGSRLVRIGPIAVTSDSAPVLRAALGGALLLVLVLSATVIWLLSRVRRASTPGAPTKGL